MRFAFIVLTAVFFWSLAVAPSSSEAVPIFGFTNPVLVVTDLGAGVYPDAINNSNQVVGQNAAGRAFLWSSGVMTDLGTLGGSSSYANDINDSGAVVGWSQDGSNVKKAFKHQGSMANLDSDWAFESAAESINANGDVVGWRTNGTQYGSVYWGASGTEGNFLFTDYVGNQKAISINNNGAVVGLLLTAAGTNSDSYYWTGSGASEQFTSTLQSGFFATAGINNNSFIAGSRFSFSALANSSDNSSTLIPKVSPGDVSQAFGLNDSEVIVGQSGQNGYIFDTTTNDLFNVNDFAFVGFLPDSLLRITDINNDGTFIGIALVDGIEHGFFAQFAEAPTANPAVPEPGSSTLFGFGLLILACVKRQRTK